MTTLPAISIDGQIRAKDQATISIFDHGFLYGDGVFEGIRIYGDIIFRGERHIDRLFRSAKVLNLKIEWSKQELLDEIKKLAIHWGEINSVDLRNNRDPLYIRLIVSRGDGDLGLNPTKCPKSKVIVVVDRISLYPPELYVKGLTLVTTVIKRNLPDALPPQVKSLNYLSNILAKMDANRQGAHEAIFMNHLGFVAEATADNLFIVTDGKIITPPVSDGALQGVTRDAALELAEKLGIPAKEDHVTLTDLFTADECFVTGTAARMAPVTTIDGRTIGDGLAGTVTKKMMEAFVSLTETDGVLIFNEVCA